MDEVIINGVKYVKEKKMATEDFVIIRTYSAGVFAGYLEKKEGKEVTLRNAIRLWRWAGAASLSQVAMEGVKNPDECKFAIPVSTIILTEVIEIISCTEIAKNNIQRVKSWKI